MRCRYRVTRGRLRVNAAVSSHNARHKAQSQLRRQAARATLAFSIVCSKNRARPPNSIYQIELFLYRIYRHIPSEVLANRTRRAKFLQQPPAAPVPRRSHYRFAHAQHAAAATAAAAPNSAARRCGNATLRRRRCRRRSRRQSDDAPEDADVRSDQSTHAQHESVRMSAVVSRVARFTAAQRRRRRRRR